MPTTTATSNAQGSAKNTDVERARASFFERMGQATTRHEVEAAFQAGIEDLDAATEPLPENPIRIGDRGRGFHRRRPAKQPRRRTKAARHEGKPRACHEHHEPQYPLQRARTAPRSGGIRRIRHRPNLHADHRRREALRRRRIRRHRASQIVGMHAAKSTACRCSRISRDYRVPVLFLSYDSQTSDTGLDTRLEAFYDMIAMRRQPDEQRNRIRIAPPRIPRR